MIEKFNLDKTQFLNYFKNYFLNEMRNAEYYVCGKKILYPNLSISIDIETTQVNYDYAFPYIYMIGLTIIPKCSMLS